MYPRDPIGQIRFTLFNGLAARDVSLRHASKCPRRRRKAPYFASVRACGVIDLEFMETLRPGFSSFPLDTFSRGVNEQRAQRVRVTRRGEYDN